MKCLTLWQPWASLVVRGVKRIETRSWGTDHRGPLLIHASADWADDLAEQCLQDPFRSALRPLIGVPPRLLPLAAAERGRDLARRRRAWGLPLGAVVGLVHVVGCDEIGAVRCEYDRPGEEPVGGVGPGLFTVPPDDPELSFGDYTPGRFAWLLDGAVAFRQPVPVRGGRRLFDVDERLPRKAGAA